MVRKSWRYDYDIDYHGRFNYMCGIFGIALLQGHTINDSKIVKVMLRRLALQSEIRGGDATGVAFATDSDISVIKHNIGAKKFVEANFYKKATELYLGEDLLKSGLRIILGHARLRTKGTPKDRNNNHPIVANRVIGVHNGTIQNDDYLFNEFIKTFPNVFKRKARVDTEIIFRLINHYKHHVGMSMHDAISTSRKLLEGSYACAMLDAASPWMLYLFRGLQPTKVVFYQKRGFILFASVRAFINDAVEGFDFEKEGVELEYSEESCLFINTIANKITTFDFGKKSVEA